MIRTRTYYCDNCSKCVDFKKDDIPQCKCGKVFGVKANLSDYINMRKTWSGQTKVEFTQTTMSEDIAKRNKR